jgi:hypothetical protein
MEDENLKLPQSLIINANVGHQGARARPSPEIKRWLLGNAPPKIRAFLKAPPKADPKDWRDPRVGWGLVLPHNPNVPREKLSTAEDAPEPIQALVKDRGQDGQPAVVLRYKQGTGRIGFLRRDGADLPVSQSTFGTGTAAIPRYLLIYGTPEQIPWEEQYALNATRAVGRLALTGTALENYVQALMTNWKDATANQDAALVCVRGPRLRGHNEPHAQIDRRRGVEPAENRFDRGSQHAISGRQHPGNCDGQHAHPGACQETPRIHRNHQPRTNGPTR